MKKRFALIALAAMIATISILVNTELYLVIVVHLAAIPAIAYPFVYRSSPWRTGPTGRALMNKALSVALLFGIAILGYWWPFPAYEFIYASAVTYLGVSITYQFYVMRRVKKLGASRMPTPEGACR
jgi:hypothetical protein